MVRSKLVWSLAVRGGGTFGCVLSGYGRWRYMVVGPLNVFQAGIIAEGTWWWDLWMCSKLVRSLAVRGDRTLGNQTPK